MAKPTTRQELIEYALRQLGAPVLEINVADEQLDDILDDTIQYFQERHYDGVIRTYLKYKFTEDDIKRGKEYKPLFEPGITTSATTYPGASGPTVNVFAENSNYIEIPPHIIGIEKVFVPPAATGNAGGYWGVGAGINLLGYDASIAAGGYLGAIGGFGGFDLITYQLAKTWWSTVDYLFNPEAAIRFNKRQDRLYLDINWNRLGKEQMILIDCYRALDPEEFNRIYNDSWVKKYLVARIKRQWGQNLLKFRGTKMPGGLEYNGRELYDDATAELQQIKDDMSSYYELPPLDLMA